MSEILDLANQIKNVKENIRTVLNNKGITTSTSVPFNQYPAKIAQIDEPKTIWARNDLESVNEGDKVWLSPISSEMKKEYKWSSTSQFGNYTKLNLSCYKGFDTLMYIHYPNACQLYNFDLLSGELTYVPNTGNIGYNILLNRSITDNIMLYYMVSSGTTSSSNTPYNFLQSLETQSFSNFEDSIIFLNHNLKAYNGNKYGSEVNVYTYDINGESVEYKGKYLSSSSNRFSPFWASNDGKILLTKVQSSGTGLNSFKKYVLDEELEEYKQQSSLSTSSGFVYGDITLGYTVDNKYIIQGKSLNQHYVCNIIEVNMDTFSLSNYNDLNITNDEYFIFYENTQILIAYTSSSIRMWKYNLENGFVEQNIDFGDITFSTLGQNANKTSVTLNYDASIMCVNDGSNGVYLFSLEAAEPNSYKATPFKRVNFNSNSVTGILSGLKDDENGTVEVRAIIS